MNMANQAAARSMSFGIGSMAVAALALVISVAHFSLGPFTPQPPVEKTIAETAVKIKQALKRAVTGEKAPKVEAVRASPLDVDRVIDVVSLVLGAGAMALAVIALCLRERSRPAFMGFSLGAGVLLMAFLQWVALIICGAILLAAIIVNLHNLVPS